MVAVALLAGGRLLALLGGDAFAQGANILIPLAIAASFDLASVAFEPVLHSTGHARYALVARAIAVVAMAVAMTLLVRYGAPGIAWAVAVGGVVSFLALGSISRHTLNRMEQRPA